MLYAFLGNHMKQPTRQAFLVFLSVYTLALFFIYSFLAYKTPWSILSAQHALTLLAGVGAAAIAGALTGKVSRLVFKIAFGLGLYHLLSQTNHAIHLYAADSRNPYVYSHTSTHLMRLLPQVRDLQKTAPDDAFNVLVINRDAGWPLPWYWRDIKSVHYTTTIPETIDARVIIAEPEMKAALEAKFAGKTYTTPDLFGLRPGVMLNLWIEQSLWDRHSLRKQQEAAKP
jgi:predicted membrane-bound mannosyltransferase